MTMSKEHPECSYFKELGDICNVCVGNEPYSCGRAQEEGLCFKRGRR